MNSSQLIYQEKPKVFVPFSVNTVEFHYCKIANTHPRRSDVEHFIAQRFMRSHSAIISNFMPNLVAMFDSRGEVVTAIGLRRAEQGALFLENYLDNAIELSIAQHDDHPTIAPTRASIVEIGNFASVNRKASLLMMQGLAADLIRGEFQWAVFTVCPSMQSMFRLMGLKILKIARASESQLPLAQQDWGQYYDKKPSVFAGQVSSAKKLLLDSSHSNAKRAAS